MSQKLAAQMLASLQARLSEIKAMSRLEIANLPEYSDTEIVAERCRYTLATWRKDLPNGVTQVVVQTYYRRILGIGSMAADGFLIDSEGNRSPIPAAVRLEYC